MCAAVLEPALRALSAAHGITIRLPKRKTKMNGISHRMMTGLLVAVLLVATSTPAAAIVFKLAPAAQIAASGDAVSLDLVVSGLGDVSSPALGDFDVEVGYDPLALSFTNYSLGLLLGDESLGEAIDFSLGDQGFSVNLGEVSLLFPSELQALQPDNFVLARLDFNVLSLLPGSSTALSLAVNAAGDEFGQPLAVDGVHGAVIRNAVIATPEPPMLLLVGTAFAGVGFARRRAPT